MGGKGPQGMALLKGAKTPPGAKKKGGKGPQGAKKKPGPKKRSGKGAQP